MTGGSVSGRLLNQNAAHLTGGWWTKRVRHPQLYLRGSAPEGRFWSEWDENGGSREKMCGLFSQNATAQPGIESALAGTLRHRAYECSELEPRRPRRLSLSGPSDCAIEADTPKFFRQMGAMHDVFPSRNWSEMADWIESIFDARKPRPLHPPFRSQKANYIASATRALSSTAGLFNSQFHSGLRRNETSGLGIAAGGR